jgi:pre-mRNA-processing factor 19
MTKYHKYLIFFYMQSWLNCSLTGEVLEEGVVSQVSGHIFERRLIEKHIQATGKCPITGRNLTLEDLIPVQLNKI